MAYIMQFIHYQITVITVIVGDSQVSVPCKDTIVSYALLLAFE